MILNENHFQLKDVVKITLADVKRGDEFIISRISDKKVRAQAIRFGISEGANLSCGDKIPGGPVILKKNFQEIAVGRNLAKNIIIDIKN